MPKCAVRRIYGYLVILAPSVAISIAAQQRQTFADISPVIYRSCTPCHSEGGPAPFSIAGFAEAKRRADRIGINVASHAMPPFLADSDFGRFHSIPGVTTDELVAIRQWATSGALPGPPTANAKQSKRVWRLGQPDLILKSPAVRVPPEGGLLYVPVKLDLPYGGCIRGLEIRPKQPRVIRQAVIGWAKRGTPVADGWTTLGADVTAICSWSFGYYVWRTPKMSGIKVDDNSELQVLLQCLPSGKAAEASFELAVYYEQFPNPTEVRWLILEKKDFIIPPGHKPEFVVQESLKTDALVTALLPEFRLACERVTLTASLPDGTSKSLVKGRWDAYWTGSYTFINPPLLPKGTVLTLRAAYSNGFDSTHGVSVRKPIVSGPLEDQELCRMRLQLVPTAAAAD